MKHQHFVLTDIMPYTSYIRSFEKAPRRVIGFLPPPLVKAAAAAAAVFGAAPEVGNNKLEVA